MAKFSILGAGPNKRKSKRKRKGIHAKTKSSKQKSSKLYLKKSVGQG